MRADTLNDISRLRRRVYLGVTVLALVAVAAAMVINEVTGIADTMSRVSGVVLGLLILPVLVTRGALQERFFAVSVYVYIAGILTAWLYALYARYSEELAQVTIFSVALWLPPVYTLFFVAFRPRTAFVNVSAIHALFVLATIPHAVSTSGGAGLLDGWRLTMLFALAHAGTIVMVYGYARLAPKLEQAHTREAELHHLAYRDPLTGLVNRRGQHAEAGPALSRARRRGWKMSLLYIDLDRFKQVNDRYGHEVGDQLLREAVARLRGGLRDTDLLARLGGDEFAFLLEDTDEVRAAALCDRILEALREPFTVGDRILRIGASIGVAVFPDDAGDLESLVRCADKAMYAAKVEGGGYRFHPRGTNAASA